MLLGLLNGMCVPLDRLRDTSRKLMIFFFGFDCDFVRPCLPKILQRSFLICLTGRCLSYAKTAVSIQAKIVVMCISNDV